MFHILYSIIFCGCFYIFHMLNSHDRSCVISQHTFHTVIHTHFTVSHIFFTAFDDVKRRTSFHMVFTWWFHIIFHRCVKLYVKNQMKISHVLHMHFTSFLPVVEWESDCCYKPTDGEQDLNFCRAFCGCFLFYSTVQQKSQFPRKVGIHGKQLIKSSCL